MLDQSLQPPVSPQSPKADDSRLLSPPFMSPTRSASFKSPKGADRPNVGIRAQSFNGLGRRVFDVDGYPLPHWDKSNFQPERDESCRVVYKPKDGSEFYIKNLRKEDFVVMRRSTMEQPFFSKYNRFFPTKGHFCCKACGNPLYSYHTKLQRADGWPAFGACIDGAVGMLTPEQRRERDERERGAAIRIQSLVRGCLARDRVCQQLDMLIEQVMKLEQEVEEEIQKGSSKKAASRRRVLGSLSLHSLHDFSLDDGDSSNSSFASFGESSSDLPEQSKGELKTQPAWTSSAKNEESKGVAASAASIAMKRAEDRKSEIQPTTPENELIEIHCHRCKSFLGNLFNEENRGQDGETMYQERHRVNGRALKYVEDNLPKRVEKRASLLHANQSQRRLMGLKPAEPQKKEAGFLFALPRQGPFVSPRSKNKKSVAEKFQSPTQRAKPGVGVRFLSPVQSPNGRKKLTSKQKKMDNFFLNRSVH